MTVSQSQQKVIFILALLVITLAGWIANNYFVLNWDVSWDLRITKRFLAGGTYIRDFVDNNPPLILFLYAPAVLLSKLSALNIMTALNMYVFALAAVSLHLCYTFAHKIFCPSHSASCYAFIGLIAMVFVLIPIVDFGEREHLMVILTLPYFLLVISRLHGVSIHSVFAASVGLFAAVGFALKPYFLAAFVLTEAYYGWETRQWLGWMRSEVLVLIGFMTAYLVSIILFFPDYIHTIVPLMRMFYYAGFNESYILVLMQTSTLLCGFALLFFLLQGQQNPYKKCANVLCLAMIGFFISYLVQQSTWRYHHYPADSYASLLLCAIITGGLLENKSRAQPPSRIVIAASIWLAACIVSQWVNTAKIGNVYKYVSGRFVAYLQHNANHQSVYILSASGDLFFPAIDYTNVTYNSRFQHLSWIPGTTKQLLAQGALSPAHRAGENFFIQMVNEDLTRIQPDIIFVDSNDVKPFLRDIRFNYLDYFSKDKTFRLLWSHYHLVTHFELAIREPDKVAFWQLYVEPRLGMLDPQSIPGMAIILSGTGQTRTARFVEKTRLLSDQVGPFTRVVELDAQDLAALQAYPITGKIAVTVQNRQALLRIIANAARNYAYRYDIYERL